MRAKPAETVIAELRRRSERAPTGHPLPRSIALADLPDGEVISAQLSALRALGLDPPYFRLNESGPTLEPIVSGKRVVSFSSYDYLGLNAHADVQAAAVDAVREWGVSASASRLVGGERPFHRGLERALAAFHQAEDCLAFVSGHATNMTGIAALLGPSDLVITDEFAHNSVVEGARASKSRRLVMPHNDLDWLDAALSRQRQEHRNVLVSVEGHYSMDGDVPDLARLVDIRRRHRVWLMVDEAHATGVLGRSGRGIAEEHGVDPSEVDLWMGTLSKALASCGGYIAGSRDAITFLKARASGFVYSTALPAPLAAAAEAALSTLLREPERVARLANNGERLRDGLRAAGLDTGLSIGRSVVPVVIGASVAALKVSEALIDRGILALPIVHPAVPERSARLRFFVTSEHSAEQIDLALRETAKVVAALSA